MPEPSTRTAPSVDSRRAFLRTGAAAFLASTWPRLNLGRQPSDTRLPVAAVATVYRDNSHADVILGKILEGFDQQGGPGPGLRLAGLYVDQFPDGDMSRGLAEKYGFPITGSIDEALTGGGDRLEVAGVLSIGEHGDYPYTAETRQHMYPRRRFFDAIVRTFERVQEVAPVFNDKHLGYAWEDARHMVETARRMEFAFMAGSSLPVTWRRPPLSLSVGVEIDEALAVGYGGFESYGFHALETLQCMVERRHGGETGVDEVTTWRGAAAARQLESEPRTMELFRAALATMPGPPEPDPSRLGDNGGLYRIHYRDGMRASVVMANGIVNQFGFAGRLRGREEPVACWFELEEGKPFGHFGYLVRAIEHMIRTGEPAYPVERTLLTTGVLDAVMHSLAAGGARRPTPELAVSYRPTDWPFINRDER